MARRFPATDVVWLGVIPAALLLFAALEWLAPPLSDLYPDPAYPFYLEVVPIRIHPEPLETVRYLLAVAVPALMAAAIVALGSKRAERRGPFGVIVGVQVAVIAFAVFTVLRQRDNVSDEFFGVILPYLLPPRNLVAGPLIGAALVALAISWDSGRLAPLRDLARRLEGQSGGIALAIAVSATALWLLPGVITDSGLGQNGVIPPGHLPIEFDEFAAAANGRTALVDFVPFYSALLPIALSPLFSAFDLSITSFTITMSVLSLLGLVAIYGALVQVTQRAWVALALYLPFLATALQPWATHGAAWEFDGNYFATLPERYLGPLVVTWLCARHLRRGSPPLWLPFFAAGLSVLNNLEFGTACLLALVVAMIAGEEREGPADRRLRTAGIQAGAGLGAALVLVAAVILIRTGELPDLALLGYAGRLAARGFSLWPMPEWGFHWVLYVTYAGALLTAAVRYANAESDRTLTGMLAYAGVLGFATGGYFAGRSLPFQLWGLFPVWGLALALLAWTAWLSLRSAAREREALRRIIVAAFAALAGFGVMVAGIDRFPLPWQQLDRISASGPTPTDDADEQRFVEDRTDPGETVLILGFELEHRIAERAGVSNASPWLATLALVGPNETGRALDQLEDEGGRKVFLRIRPTNFVTNEGITSHVADLLRERGYRRLSRDAASGTVEWELPG